MPKQILCLLILFPFLAFNQSYQKFHKDAIVIDTHNDVLSTVTMKGLNIDNDLTGKSHSDINRFKKGGIDIQVFSIFCDERFGKDTAFKFANIEIDSLYSIVNRNRNKMMIVTDPKQLYQALKERKLGCMMGVEGGHMIEDQLENLDKLYLRGARYMTLTWNNSTSWASSASDETTDTFHNEKKGLNEFGKQVVKRMNQLGMMIDLSHVGEKTFWDAINTTTKPVIVSHSCVYNLCPVFRNLKDEQIKAVGKNGGVIHVNFYSGFIDSNYAGRKNVFLKRHSIETDSLKHSNLASYEIEEWISKKYAAEADSLRPPLSILLDHIDYIVKLIGVDHVGLGSDFDGIESAPQTLDDVTTYPFITKALFDRGYSRQDIKKILGENFIRIFEANQKH
ncbi:MAG TPA: dipeptidase [Flavisolibacter sp.]|jgi:membrane dipeptidase|nr:dipeptidase [Flavisolibacter sp.]